MFHSHFGLRQLHCFNPRVTLLHAASVTLSINRAVLLYQPNGQLLGILEVCLQTGNFPPQWHNGSGWGGGWSGLVIHSTPTCEVVILFHRHRPISLRWCRLQAGPGLEGRPSHLLQHALMNASFSPSSQSFHIALLGLFFANRYEKCQTWSW